MNFPSKNSEIKFIVIIKCKVKLYHMYFGYAHCHSLFHAPVVISVEKKKMFFGLHSDLKNNLYCLIKLWEERLPVDRDVLIEVAMSNSYFISEC